MPRAGEWDYAGLLPIMQDTTEETIEVYGLTGERHIACGWEDKKHLILHGTAGNNLGASTEPECYEGAICGVNILSGI